MLNIKVDMEFTVVVGQKPAADAAVCAIAMTTNKPVQRLAGWLRDCCRVGDYSCIDNTPHKYSNSINTSRASANHVLWLAELCTYPALNTVWACAQFKFKSSIALLWSRSTGMPVGLSADLRWRIVYLICIRGYTIAQTAKDLSLNSRACL